jgi:hypothetical protein
MAVTQISTIQVRYGLQADIGNLAAGEFAWAIDTQRLFIGNGDISEGAPYGGLTEITTSGASADLLTGNYTYAGILGGYIAKTGPSVDIPVVRQLQDKIDDFINVRDFGAAGTGNADDTEAIQRALDEIYNRRSNTVSPRTRRVIRFSAGIYRITRDLKLPPYTTLEGDGKSSVTLSFVGSKAKLTTSIGGNPADLNTAVEYPSNIHIKGLTFKTNTDADIFGIDSASNIVFEDVGFVGPQIGTLNAPTTNGAQGSCVSIKSSVYPTLNVNFTRCVFSGMPYAVYIDAIADINNISFNNCEFNDLYSGIYTVNNGTGQLGDITVTGSVFKGIATNAIYGDAGVKGIVSTGNKYVNCGSNQAGEQTPTTAWHPVIVFQADNNYSVADIFARNIENSATYPRIQANGYRIVSISIDDALRLGSSYTAPGRTAMLTNGTAGSVDLPNFLHGVLTYSLSRNNHVRTGTIKVTGLQQPNSPLTYDDDYVESQDIGVDLTLTKNNNTVQFNWVVSSTGTDVILNFDTKTLH